MTLSAVPFCARVQSWWWWWWWWWWDSPKRIRRAEMGNRLSSTRWNRNCQPQMEEGRYDNSLSLPLWLWSIEKLFAQSIELEKNQACWVKLMLSCFQTSTTDTACLIHSNGEVCTSCLSTTVAIKRKYVICYKAKNNLRENGYQTRLSEWHKHSVILIVNMS